MTWSQLGLSVVAMVPLAGCPWLVGSGLVAEITSVPTSRPGRNNKVGRSQAESLRDWSMTEGHPALWPVWWLAGG